MDAEPKNTDFSALLSLNALKMREKTNFSEC